MTIGQDEAMKMIRDAIKLAVNDEPEITERTDLINDEILDSLDSMVFVMELEKLSGIKFPEEDLEEAGFYSVPKLLEHICGA